MCFHISLHLSSRFASKQSRLRSPFPPSIPRHPSAAPFFPPLQLSPADERSNSLLLLREKLRENKWKEGLEEEGRGKNKEGEMKRGLPAEKNGRAGER